MCALTPPFPTKLGWSALDYPSLSRLDSFFPIPPPSHEPLQWKAEMDRCPSFAENIGNNNNGNSNNSSNSHREDQSAVVIKKLSHNASERDRRQKLNALYSSLRSLLPADDQTKKLSIPATVSRALKYIPEQQQEVERLSRKKEEILKRISRQSSDSGRQKRHGEQLTTSALSPGIIVTRLSETEIAVQISAVQKTPVSDVLLSLEENGLRVISASSSVSSSTRVFYSLHLEMDRGCEAKLEEMSDMILALHEKKDHWRPQVTLNLPLSY